MAKFKFPSQKDEKQTIICLNPSDLYSATQRKIFSEILQAEDTYIISPDKNELEMMFNHEIGNFLTQYKPNNGDIYIVEGQNYVNINTLNYYQSDLELIRHLTDFCQILGATYLNYKSTSYLDFSKTLGLDINTTGLIKKLIDPSLNIDLSRENAIKQNFEKTNSWQGHEKEKINFQKASMLINTLPFKDQSLFKHILNQRIQDNSIESMKEKIVIKRNHKNNFKILAELAIKIPINNTNTDTNILKLKNSIIANLTNIFEHTIELEIRF
ncbi:MAG: hypothetical protein Q4B49_03835 [Acinetobacter sp.]|uniref:hypothetical protein n=1 Tax=Acinetobacter sp. TaxID=472 RepID=UPI0026DD6640|nr:hypothetical protein [Acinetobacter sp.]MDO4579167.1 hypothetical protein [Acinetobacter sp.]